MGNSKSVFIKDVMANIDQGTKNIWKAHDDDIIKTCSILYNCTYDSYKQETWIKMKVKPDQILRLIPDKYKKVKDYWKFWKVESEYYTYL